MTNRFLGRLERRVLLEGAMDFFADTSDDRSLEDSFASEPVLNMQEPPKSVLLVVDERVPFDQEQVDALGAHVELLFIAPSEDGLKKAHNRFAAGTPFQSIHILSHGAQGRVFLGASDISAETLDRHSRDVQALGQLAETNGDIFLYACDVAEGDEGQTFVEEFAQLTRRDVAASNDVTGSSGDWELEVSVGELEALPFQFDNIAALTSRPSVLLGGILTPSEDGTIVGLSVAAENSTLMGRVLDQDGDDVSIHSFQGSTDLGTPQTVFVSFVDPVQNEQQSIALQLTVSADGAYALQTATALDVENLAKLGADRIAAGTFSYTVVDSSGLVSLDATGILQVTGVNDAPVAASPTTISITEDALSIGSEAFGAGAVSVGPAPMPLANGLLGTLDDADTLVVSKVGVANVPAVGGRIVTLSFSDDQLIDQPLDVLVQQDGSVSFEASDFTWLPDGDTAKASFTYQVIDEASRISGERQASIIITGGTPPTFVLDLNSDLGLLTHGFDIDDTKTRLKVGEIDGEVVTTDSIQTVTLSYTTATGAAATFDLVLTVHQTGKLSFEAQDFQELGLGETATGTFTYRLRDHAGDLSDLQTASIELQGGNDQPQIRGDLSGTVMASENTRFVNGSLKVYDVDQGEAALAAFLVDESGTRLELDGQGRVEGAYGIWLIDTDTGTYNYTLDVDNTDVVGLTTGETLTEKVTFSSADETVSKEVVITIQGPSVAPVVTVGLGDTANASLTESQTDIGVFGTLSVEDANVFQKVTADVSAVRVSGRSDGMIASEFQKRSLMYFVDPIAVKSGQSTGTLTWGFSSDTVSFDYLEAGEHVTLEFDVTLTDERLEKTTQVITITVQGENSPATLDVPDMKLSSAGSGTYEIDLHRYVSDVDFGSDPSFVVEFSYPGGTAPLVAPTIDAGTISIDPASFGDLSGQPDQVIDVQVTGSDDGVAFSYSFSITVAGDEAPNGPNVGPYANTLFIVPVRENGAERTERFYTNHSIADTPLQLSVRFVDWKKILGFGTYEDDAYPSSDEMETLLTLADTAILAGEDTFITFNSGQLDLSFLELYDRKGLHYQVVATDTFGNEFVRDYYIALEGKTSPDLVSGPQIVATAFNPDLYKSSTVAKLFYDANFVSASGSSMINELVVRMERGSDDEHLYLFEEYLGDPADISGRYNDSGQGSNEPRLVDGVYIYELAIGYTAERDGGVYTIYKTNGDSFDANAAIENLSVRAEDFPATHTYYDTYRARVQSEIVRDLPSSGLEQFNEWKPEATPVVELISLTDERGQSVTLGDKSVLTYSQVPEIVFSFTETVDQDTFSDFERKLRGSSQRSETSGWDPVPTTSQRTDAEISTITRKDSTEVAIQDLDYHVVEGRFGSLVVLANTAAPNIEFIPNDEAINALLSDAEEVFYLQPDLSNAYQYSQETFGDWANDAQTVQIRVQITAENDAPDLTVTPLSPTYTGSDHSSEWLKLFDTDGALDAIEEGQVVSSARVEIQNVSSLAEEKIRLADGTTFGMDTPASHVAGDTTVNLSFETRTELVKQINQDNIVTYDSIETRVAVIELTKVSGLSMADISGLEYQFVNGVSTFDGDRVYQITALRESLGLAGLQTDWADVDSPAGTIVDFNFMVNDVEVVLSDTIGPDIFGTIDGYLAGTDSSFSFSLRTSDFGNGVVAVGSTDIDGTSYQTLTSPLGTLLVDPETGYYLLQVDSQAVNDLETGSADDNVVAFQVRANDSTYGDADFNFNLKIDALPESGALYVEQDEPGTLIENVSLYTTRSESIDVRYFDIDISGDNPTVSLSVPNSATIDTTENAISFRDNKVYLGLGDQNYLLIGYIDPVLNGTNGKVLRVVMEQDLPDGDFTNPADYVVPTNGIADATTVRPEYEGWTFVDQFSEHGFWRIQVQDQIWVPGDTTLEIEGATYVAPTDTTQPIYFRTGMPFKTIEAYKPSGFSRSDYYIYPLADGGINFNVNTETNQAAVIRDVLMYSDPFAAVAGTTFSYDWAIGGTKGQADILSYLLNLDSGEWHEVQNISQGSSVNSASGWWNDPNRDSNRSNPYYNTNNFPDDIALDQYQTASHTIEEAGRYAFVFVPGVADPSTFWNASVDVYLKNVEIVGTKSLATNEMVARVIEKIRYADSSDLTAENTRKDRGVNIAVTTFDGRVDTLDVEFEVQEVNDNPVSDEPNKYVVIEETNNFDRFEITGDFDVTDPDANTQLSYYSVDSEGSARVDENGDPLPIQGQFGELRFGGAGAGWTYTVDPFKIHELGSNDAVSEVFAGLQGSDGDGGLINLSLTFRIDGAADETSLNVADTSAADTHEDIVNDSIFGGSAVTGFSYSISGVGVVDTDDEQYVETAYGRVYLHKSTGSVRYEPISDPFNQSGLRETVTLLATDGTNTATHDLHLEVAGVNDAPSISGDDMLVYEELSGPLILAPTGTISDAEQDWNGARLLIDYDTDDVRLEGDTLRLVGDGISVDGADITVAGLIVGTIDAVHNGKDGAALEITFNAAAQQSHVEAVYQAVAFEQTTKYPTGKDNLRIAVSLTKTIDDNGHGTPADALSDSVTQLVSLQPENNPPEVLLDQSIWEGQRHTQDNPNGRVAITGVSIDDDGLTGHVVLSIDEALGHLTVSDSIPVGVTGADISDNGTHSVRMTGTWAAINATLAAIDGLVFEAQDGVDIVSPGDVVLSITASDTPQLTGVGRGSIVVYPADETGMRADLSIIEDNFSPLDLRPFVSDSNNSANPVYELGTLSEGVFTALSDLADSSYGSFVPTAEPGVYNYTPPQDFFGVHGLAYRFTGDSGNPVEAPLNIYVLSSNDAPSVESIDGNDAEFRQGGSPVSVFSNADLSAYEVSDNIVELRLIVSGVAAENAEFLELPDGVEVDLTKDVTGVGFDVQDRDGALEVVLTGVWSVAEAEALLNGLTYRTDEFAPIQSSRVISLISIKDSAGVVHQGIDTATYDEGVYASTIGVQMTLSLPTVTLQTTTLDTVEDTTLIVDTNARIFSQAASELDDYAGHTLIVGSDLVEGADVLGFGTSTAFTAANGVIRDASGLAFATYSTVNGKLVVAFDSAEAIAAQALVDTVSGAITYQWVDESTVYLPSSLGSASIFYIVSNDAGSDDQSLSLSLESVQDDADLSQLDANQHAIEPGADWVNLYAAAKIDNPEAFSGVYEVTLTFSNIDDAANEYIRLPGVFSTSLEGGTYIRANADGSSEKVVLYDFPKTVRPSDRSVVNQVKVQISTDDTATVVVQFNDFYAGKPLETLLEGLQYKRTSVDWTSPKLIDVSITNLRELTLNDTNPFGAPPAGDRSIPSDWERAQVSLTLPPAVSYTENGSVAPFTTAFDADDFAGIGPTTGNVFSVGRMNSDAGITANAVDVFNFDPSTNDRLTVSGSDVLLDNILVGTLSGTGTSQLSVDLSVDLTASELAVLAQAITYEIASEDPETAMRLAWSVSGTTASGVIDVAVTPVDDVPTVALTRVAREMESSGIDYEVFKSVTLSPVEAAQSISHLELEFRGIDTDELTNHLIIDGDLFSLDTDIAATPLASADFADVSFGYTIDAGVGRLSFSDIASTEQAEKLLEALRFRTTAAADNSTLSTTRDLRLVGVTDTGDVSKNTLSVSDDRYASSFTFPKVNNAPTLDAVGDNPRLVEGADPATLFSSASVTLGLDGSSTEDTDQTISDLELTVTNVSSGNFLSIDDTEVALTDDTSGTTIGGVEYTVTMTGSTATVALSGSLSATQTATLVQSLKFGATGDLDILDRVVTLTSIKDTGGTPFGSSDTTSLSLSSTVSLVSVDQAPSLDLTGEAVNFAAGATSGVTLFSEATVSAIETDQRIKTLVLRVDGETLTATETLKFWDTQVTFSNGQTDVASDAEVSVVTDRDGLEMTLAFDEPFRSMADVEALLKGLEYLDSNGAAASNTRTVTVTSISDTGDDTVPSENTSLFFANTTGSGELQYHAVVTIEARNQAPIVIAPSEPFQLASGSINVTGLRVVDVDDTSVSVVIETNQDNAGYLGTLTLSSTADGISLSNASGNGSGRIQINSVDLDKLNATLAGISYSARAGFDSSAGDYDAITLTATDDSGAVGAGIAAVVVAPATSWVIVEDTSQDIDLLIDGVFELGRMENGSFVPLTPNSSGNFETDFATISSRSVPFSDPNFSGLLSVSPNADAHGVEKLAYQVNGANPIEFDLHVLPVNDAPTIEGAASAFMWVLDSNPTSQILPFTDLTVDNIESGQTIDQVTFTLEGDASDVTLTLADQDISIVGGASGTIGDLDYTIELFAGSHTITVVGAWTLPEATSLIRTLGFATSNQEINQDYSLTLTSLRDSGGTALSGQDTADVVETADIRTMNEQVPSLSAATTATATEQVVSSNLLGDFNVDHDGLEWANDGAGDFSKSKLYVSFTDDASALDLFGLAFASTSSYSANTNDKTVTKAGAVIASYEDANGELAIAFGNSVSRNDVNAVARAVAFTADTDQPNTTAADVIRTVRATFTDVREMSASVDTAVTVVSVDDPGTIVSSGQSVTFTEGDSGVSLFSSTAIDLIEEYDRIASVQFKVTNVTDANDVFVAWQPCDRCTDRGRPVGVRYRHN